VRPPSSSRMPAPRGSPRSDECRPVTQAWYPARRYFTGGKPRVFGRLPCSRVRGHAPCCAIRPSAMGTIALSRGPARGRHLFRGRGCCRDSQANNVLRSRDIQQIAQRQFEPPVPSLDLDGQLVDRALDPCGESGTRATTPADPAAGRILPSPGGTRRGIARWPRAATASP
jgi:hypothetical protein